MFLLLTDSSERFPWYLGPVKYICRGMIAVIQISNKKLIWKLTGRWRAAMSWNVAANQYEIIGPILILFC